MSDVWSQTVRVAWRPSLRFYERRVPFMREIEEEHDLLAFRVEPDLGAVRFNRNEMFELSPRGALLTATGPDVSTDRLRETLRKAIDEFARGEASVVYVATQFLVPLEGEYDELCARLTSRHVSVIDGAGDIAVLLGGEVEDLSANYNLEYGIINSSEAPDRLTRAIGNIGSTVPELRDDLPAGLTFPNVSLFLDVVWTSSALMNECGQVEELWDAILERTESMVTQLTGLTKATDGYHDGETEVRP